MSQPETRTPVIITQLKWAGRWGPLRIASRCGECDAVTAILRGMMEKDFKGKDVVFEVKPWLDNVFFALRRGAWHPPIILVNGKKFYQFSHARPVFDRRRLVARVNDILDGRGVSAAGAGPRGEERCSGS